MAVCMRDERANMHRAAHFSWLLTIQQDARQGGQHGKQQGLDMSEEWSDRGRNQRCPLTVIERSPLRLEARQLDRIL